MRGSVFEESRVRIFELFELGFDGFSETIVDHSRWWWRRRSRSRLRRSEGRGRRCGTDGGEEIRGGAIPRPASSSKEMLKRHRFRRRWISFHSL